MTRDDVLAMPAGEELDRLVAVHVLNLIECDDEVLGHGWHSADWTEQWYVEDGGLPKFSTDIAAAWRVVEALTWKFEMANWHEDEWYVLLGDRDGEHVRVDTGGANAATLAICRAALLTVLD